MRSDGNALSAVVFDTVIVAPCWVAVSCWMTVYTNFFIPSAWVGLIGLVFIRGLSLIVSFPITDIVNSISKRTIADRPNEGIDCLHS